MIICDRTWLRDGVAVEAQHEVNLDEQETLHLCATEFEALREWIYHPEQRGTLGEQVSKTLTNLSGKLSLPRGNKAAPAS